MLLCEHFNHITRKAFKIFLLTMCLLYLPDLTHLNLVDLPPLYLCTASNQTLEVAKAWGVICPPVIKFLSLSVPCDPAIALDV